MLSVKDLKVYFQLDGGFSRAVDGVSFEIQDGETVCLVGESGCGKSVSALTIMGILPQPPGKIIGGTVLFKGQNLLLMKEEEMQKVRGNHIAMVFQEPMTSLNPVFTIGEQIEEAIRIHERIDEGEMRKRSIQALKDVGMPSPEQRINDYPHQLSGGQRQRVMIAMALACNPDLVIADEPTTALDVTVQAQILNLFKDLQQKRRMSLLYITHDLGVVAKIADQIYVMYAGIILEKGTAGDIFHNPCHPYTRALLASLPSRSKRGSKLYNIPGSVPDPAHKPKGCPFHPRCSFALESCTSQFPGMSDWGNGHFSRCPVIYDKEARKGGN